MERITKKQVEIWLSAWNNSQRLKLHLECYNAWYHIKTERGTTIADGKSAGKCWDSFCQFRSGYFTALDVYRNEI